MTTTKAIHWCAENGCTVVWLRESGMVEVQHPNNMAHFHGKTFTRAVRKAAYRMRRKKNG